MGVRAILLAVVLLCLGVNSSFAQIRIYSDPGGQIGEYFATYAEWRETGEEVVIDGPCLSACTLILAMLPSDQVCVTSRAMLGFHAAWHPDGNGNRIHSTSGTRVLMEAYPPKVRKWIQSRGGLNSRMIFLQGRELRAFYRPC